MVIILDVNDKENIICRTNANKTILQNTLKKIVD